MGELGNPRLPCQRLLILFFSREELQNAPSSYADQGDAWQMHPAAMQTKEVLADAFHHLGALESCLWTASGCCTAATMMLGGGSAQDRGVGSRALPLRSSSRSSSQLSSSGRCRCRGSAPKSGRR
jgi:hypothetical protein